MSPAFLAACDRVGMLVMDEAFDCWSRGENPDPNPNPNPNPNPTPYPLTLTLTLTLPLTLAR